MKRKMGLRPSPRSAGQRQFAQYLSAKQLPLVPSSFGHYRAIPPVAWGDLGNSTVANCYPAGAAHSIMLWNAANSNRVQFASEDVLRDYSAITGYTATDPATDTGTDMNEGGKYWQDVGFRDIRGVRHMIAGQISLAPDNLDEVHRACWLFGTAGLGLSLPESAERQFDSGHPWTVVEGSEIVGGHFVPYVGRLQDETCFVVTWGKLQAVSPDFLDKYLFEASVFVSSEYIGRQNRSPEGFDMPGLLADLQEDFT